MNQSRLTSFRESCSNTAIGFGLSLAAQAFVLPLLGVTVTPAQNVAFALVMTAVSVARGYVIRRWFERKRESFPISPAVVAVLAERRRQREVLGYDAANDDAQMSAGELFRAGGTYALHASRFKAITEKGQNYFTRSAPIEWPWRDGWNAEGERRDGVKAAALIIAGLESCDRNRDKEAA